MTIGEYASKWAAVEHRALQGMGVKDPLFLRENRRRIFFEWAKDDQESPIALALRSGAEEDSVENEFNSAYNDMLKILWKMSL